MNLLIFSDSHGSRRAIERVLSRQWALPMAQRPEYILFLGDGLVDLEGLNLPPLYPCLPFREIVTVFLRMESPNFVFPCLPTKERL